MYVWHCMMFQGQVEVGLGNIPPCTVVGSSIHPSTRGFFVSSFAVVLLEVLLSVAVVVPSSSSDTY